VECFPDADRDPIFANMYTERATLRDGQLHLTDKPGFGFAVDWDFVRRYRG
jgi:D-galactarolactone cycloisomerase